MLLGCCWDVEKVSLRCNVVVASLVTSWWMYCESRFQSTYQVIEHDLLYHLCVRI